VAASVRAVAEQVCGLCFARPPTLGPGRLVCIDGPAGSGKTTLAAAVVTAARRRLPTVTLLHMDDLYEGWDGLDTVAQLVRGSILDPLLVGRSGRYRRWDWLAGARAEEHLVDPVSLLVIEGVGSGALASADAITALVWTDAPPDVRLERGIERDGEALRTHWQRWMEAEARHFATQRTRERADLVLDTWSSPA
jgi:uridine kinase